jgi:hypothetical protein
MQVMVEESQPRPLYLPLPLPLMRPYPGMEGLKDFDGARRPVVL